MLPYHFSGILATYHFLLLFHVIFSSAYHKQEGQETEERKRGRKGPGKVR